MIRVHELTKRYGEVLAVNHVTFEVQRGEVVGFLGPNGAGKSTTMRCLTGYLRADGGAVSIDGREVHPDDVETRRRVGYLPESTPLYRRMRVGDYLDFVGRVRGFDRRARREALERVLATCGLEGFVGRRIAELSKGYRQRVGLAQALFADPDVLVLDEPTSGLDPAEITRIRELVRELGRTKTILLSTHVLSEVQEVCRRVVILAAGRVVADGTPVDLAEGERAGLRVTLTIPDGTEDVPGALAALGGVEGVRTAGEDDAGRRAFALEVEERFAVAEGVVALARERGWGLVELRHELPDLEQVFLRRTRA